MIYEVIPRGTHCMALSYEGTNFLELKRILGDKIEKGNKSLDRDSPLLLNTPYGVQRVVVGDVIVNHGKFWQAIPEEEFVARYEIIR